MTYKWHGRAFRDALQKELRRSVERAGVIVQREMKSMLNRSGSPSSPGRAPGKDTGTLGRSIQVDRSQAGRLKVRIGTNLIYGRIQEEGGVIRPKRVKRLPVPLNREAKFMLRRGQLRSANLTYIPRGGRDPLLVRKLPGGGIKPMFVLKKEVRLPARPWAKPSLKMARKRVLREIRRALRAAERAL